MKIKNILALNLEKIRLYLLVVLIFTLPNSVAINNIILVCLLIYWLFKGDKESTLKIIKDNPIVFFLYLIFSLYLISLLWSENLKWSFHIIGKQISFLFLPILMSLIKIRERKLLIFTFIISMMISTIISYLAYFKIVNISIHGYDYTPFMSHISYNPFLAFAIYLSFFYIFFDRTINAFIKLGLIIFSILMIVNIFITGGRAGQIVFLIILIIFFFQRFELKIKNIIFFILFFGGIIYISYNNSHIFKSRLDKTIKDVKHFNAPPIKGKGERRIFWRNTLKIIENNPILGVGVGDFPEEYNKVNKKFTPLAKTTVQPHNMFLFLYASSGILAFLAIIILLFYQVLMGLNSKDEYKPIKLIFPIFFFIIMLTDSYLLGHFTTILFITFSAILYKDATWKILKAGK